MTSAPPFAAPRYPLDSCELRVVHTPEEAHFLSTLLATMDPWRTLGYTASALERYLLHAEAALYRYAVVVESHMSGVVCIRYPWLRGDRKSTRLNSSHDQISYAVFCLKKNRN